MLGTEYSPHMPAVIVIVTAIIILPGRGSHLGVQEGKGLWWSDPSSSLPILCFQPRPHTHLWNYLVPVTPELLQGSGLEPAGLFLESRVINPHPQAVLSPRASFYLPRPPFLFLVFSWI